MTFEISKTLKRIGRALAATAGIALVFGAAPGIDRSVAQAEPLRIVVSATPSFTFMAYIVAEQREYGTVEKTIGRKLDVTYAKSPNPALLALLADEQDVGIMYVHNAIRAQAEGKDLVVLAALMDTQTIALMARTDRSDIKSIRDLKGKVFGVVSMRSGHHLAGLAIAKAGGIDPNHITFRSTAGARGWIPAMRSKRVDVLLVSEPTISKLLKQNLGRIVVDLHDRKASAKIFGGPHPTVSLVAKRKFVEANPKAAKALVEAHLRALTWIHSSSVKDIAAVLPKRLSKRPNIKDIINRVRPAVSRNGRVSDQAIGKFISLLKMVGDVPKGYTLKPSRVLYTKYLAK